MSAIIMLIVNPYFLVYDVGFLLSYSALIGLIYFDTLKNTKTEEIKIPPPSAPPFIKGDKREEKKEKGLIVK